jgi:hypothetical protein
MFALRCSKLIFLDCFCHRNNYCQCRCYLRHIIPAIRVSFETSFNSKQPKLEPKLVLALSETKRLFRLFRFYTETESFDVSIEPKQTEDQPKQFDREHILLFCRKFRVFPFFSGFFRYFWFLLGFFSCFASIPKQRISMF